MAKGKLMTAAEAGALSVKNQDTAVANIVGLITEAATAGYISIHVDPMSDYVTDGLRGLGYKVDIYPGLAQSPNSVRISW